MDLSNNKLTLSIMKLNSNAATSKIAMLPIIITIALTFTASKGSTLCRSAGALVLIHHHFHYGHEFYHTHPVMLP